MVQTPLKPKGVVLSFFQIPLVQSQPMTNTNTLGPAPRYVSPRQVGKRVPWHMLVFDIKGKQMLHFWDRAVALAEAGMTEPLTGERRPRSMSARSISKLLPDSASWRGPRCVNTLS